MWTTISLSISSFCVCVQITTSTLTITNTNTLVPFYFYFGLAGRFYIFTLIKLQAINNDEVGEDHLGKLQRNNCVYSSIFFLPRTFAAQTGAALTKTITAAAMVAAAAEDAMAVSHRQSEAECLNAKLDAMCQKQRMRGQKMDRKALEHTLLGHDNKPSACAWSRLLGQVQSAKREDEGPSCNDEVRSFVHTYLSRACVRCSVVLSVYDRSAHRWHSLSLTSQQQRRHACNHANNDHGRQWRRRDRCAQSVSVLSAVTRLSPVRRVSARLRQSQRALAALEMSQCLRCHLTDYHFVSSPRKLFSSARHSLTIAPWWIDDNNILFFFLTRRRKFMPFTNRRHILVVDSYLF